MDLCIPMFRNGCSLVVTKYMDCQPYNLWQLLFLFFSSRKHTLTLLVLMDLCIPMFRNGCSLVVTKYMDCKPYNLFQLLFFFLKKIVLAIEGLHQCINLFSKMFAFWFIKYGFIETHVGVANCKLQIYSCSKLLLFGESTFGWATKKTDIGDKCRMSGHFKDTERKSANLISIPQIVPEFFDIFFADNKIENIF